MMSYVKVLALGNRTLSVGIGLTKRERGTQSKREVIEKRR